jgi:uncharacterized protein (DUF433 family)
MSTTLDSAVSLLAQMSRAEKAQLLQWAAQEVGGAWAGVESHQEICGGETCIVRTRIPVWLLENARRHGATEAKLLRDYPTLTAQDLVNAWAYARSNRAEVNEAITANEAEAVSVSKLIDRGLAPTKQRCA